MWDPWGFGEVSDHFPWDPPALCEKDYFNFCGIRQYFSKIHVAGAQVLGFVSFSMFQFSWDPPRDPVGSVAGSYGIRSRTRASASSQNFRPGEGQSGVSSKRILSFSQTRVLKTAMKMFFHLASRGVRGPCAIRRGHRGLRSTSVGRKFATIGHQ